MTAPLLAALGRPRWWAIALAGFLVRGGIVLLVLPIVILPTPSGLANVFGPAVTGLALGGAGVDLLALIALVCVAATAALLVGGWLGAWLEAALVREVVAAEELGDVPARIEGVAARGLVARLVAHVPLVVAIAAGIPALVDAGYAELILPEELATPLAVRILARVPATIGLIVAAWAIGEVIGGLAVRGIVAGRTTPRALVAALAAVGRRPLGALAVLVSTHAFLLVVLVPGLLAAGTAWDRVRILLTDGLATPAETIGLAAALLVFVALWLGGFVLAGLATAVRAVAWTAWLFAPGARPATLAADPASSRTGA